MAMGIFLMTCYILGFTTTWDAAVVRNITLSILQGDSELSIQILIEDWKYFYLTS